MWVIELCVSVAIFTKVETTGACPVHDVRRWAVESGKNENNYYDLVVLGASGFLVTAEGCRSAS